MSLQLFVMVFSRANRVSRILLLRGSCLSDFIHKLDPFRFL